MNKTTIVVAVVPLVIVAGVVVTIAATLGSSSPQAPALESASGTTGLVNAVGIATPAPGAFSRRLDVPASLEPYEAADLYAKISGYVSVVKVDIGSVVSAGDPLIEIAVPEMAESLNMALAMVVAGEARIDAFKAESVAARLGLDSALAQLQRARAEADLHRVTLRRSQELFDAQAIPEQALDEARNRAAIADVSVLISEADVAAAEGEIAGAAANVRVADAEAAVDRAKVARLRTLMEYAVITAPFDGVITGRFVDRGAFVRSAADGTTLPLLSIAGVGRLRLTMNIPETSVSAIGVGTDVEVIFPAVGGPPLEASISRTAYALDPATRTMRVEVDMDDQGGRLQPGMYAKVAILIDATQGVLTVPSAAIRVYGDDTYVLVVADGVAVKAPVTIGYDDGMRAEIVAGLRGDEHVIVSATSAVAPGVRVEPVPVNRSTDPAQR